MVTNRRSEKRELRVKMQGIRASYPPRMVWKANEHGLRQVVHVLGRVSAQYGWIRGNQAETGIARHLRRPISAPFNHLVYCS